MITSAHEALYTSATVPANIEPSVPGHSIGHWEDGVLVVDTVGYNEGFWLDRRGSPHTDRLHTLEKFTRTNERAIHYETLVDDPGAYTRPWSASWTLRWVAGKEMPRHLCQENRS